MTEVQSQPEAMPQPVVKPGRKQRKVPDAQAAPPEPSETVSIPETDEEKRVRVFLEQVKEARKPQPPAPEPAPLTSRQLKQTERELEAGRKRVAAVAEQQKNVQPRKPEPGDGTNTPILRPVDYTHETDHGARVVRG